MKPSVSGHRPPSLDPERGRAVERHQEKWLAMHDGMPGAEVHRDADVTWVVQGGVAWSSHGTALRFDACDVERRLDEVLRTFAARHRGGGFWVDVDATPTDLETHLKARRLRCRKHYPGMWADLANLPSIDAPEGLRVAVVDDHDVYQKYPHPYFGPITTPIRRYELARLEFLRAGHPQSIYHCTAWEGERPVGTCTVCCHDGIAGFHDVGVLESDRRRGIGAAVMAFALRFVRDLGNTGAVLLSSGMGRGMYERVGFREVCRMGFWYKAPSKCDEK